MIFSGGLASCFMESTNSVGDGKKVDFYKTSENEKFVWVEDQVPLTEEIGQVRKSIQTNCQCVHNCIESGLDKWFSLEKHFTKYVNSVSVPDEKAFPALLYIGIGGLGGTVLARGMVSKIIYPIVFAAGTSAYFMPKTSSKIAFKALDSVYAPDDRMKHWENVSEVVQMPGQFVRDVTDTLEHSISQFLDK